MAERYLWREVVLVPNQECVLGFTRSLKGSKVAREITKVVYDGCFGSFFRDIKNYKPAPYLIKASKRHDPIAQGMVERASWGHFQPHEDPAIEVAMLTRALMILPSLREVQVREYEDAANSGSSDRVPFFYRKICRALKIDDDIVNFSRMVGAAGRSYTKGILNAAFSAGCRLQSFQARNLDGRVLFGVVPMKSAAAHQQMSIFKNIIQNTCMLELSFRNDTLTDKAEHIKTIQSLLHGATLKTLRIQLTDRSITRYLYSDDELLSDLAELLETPAGNWRSRPLLRHLETLIIDACICHNDDLLHFLKIHCSTLRRLELSNVTLLGGEDQRECWVKLIKRFKTDLRLSSISFSGWLSNGGRQQWSVAKDNVGTGRLKARVERYVVDKSIRECPLEHVAIKRNQSDVEKPSNGEECEGDLSWTMVYSNRFGDQMDWQLTPPSFGISSGAPLALDPPPASLEQTYSSDMLESNELVGVEDPFTFSFGVGVTIDFGKRMLTANGHEYSLSELVFTGQGWSAPDSPEIVTIGPLQFHTPG